MLPACRRLSPLHLHTTSVHSILGDIPSSQKALNVCPATQPPSFEPEEKKSKGSSRKGRDKRGKQGDAPPVHVESHMHGNGDIEEHSDRDSSPDRKERSRRYQKYVYRSLAINYHGSALQVFHREQSLLYCPTSTKA